MLPEFVNFTPRLTEGVDENAIDAIIKFYGTRRAKRSQVPLINHIVEGVGILRHINASTDAIAAFCIHPLLQGDEEFAQNFSTLNHLSGTVIALAVEYRSIANAYLSHRTIYAIDEIKLSPVKDVNDMLTADKVQNYKDFLLYHHGTHPRSNELNTYFKNWLDRLDCNHVMDEIFPKWKEYTSRES